MIEPEEARDLFSNLFNKPFGLVDLAKIEDEVLKKQAQEHVQGIALLMTLKHVFNKNLTAIFEKSLAFIFKQLDEVGGRDSLTELLYYLLNEGKYLENGRFWKVIHQEFSVEVEEKTMTIAQQLEARGEARGEAREKVRHIESLRNIIKRLLEKKSPPEFISEVTGLSLEEIDVLQDKH